MSRWLRRFLLLISVGLACFIVYFVTHFHTTRDGAYQELTHCDKTYIQLSDDRYVLVIDNEGNFSLAITKIIYPFGFYKDYEVFPTTLNLHDKLPKVGVSYSAISASKELYFGITDRTDISFMASVPNLSFSDKEYLKREAVSLVPLKNQKKFWYNYEPSKKGKPPEHILFLNDNKEIVKVW
ncbi:hypothetical protein [Bacillus sp. NEB1478]|uniref:hypothetical protein n=1 Tax=Bacillus sp. NEB1478 TaxID=3073816 RepID=UPI002873192E|nr:hypothetical protein [Bacillus sp. NEB1478]WNB90821.1 hypothetical protein RGB74_12970 [Bacillus sp. NEB1478]